MWARPRSKSAGTNKATEWSGGGRWLRPGGFAAVRVVCMHRGASSPRAGDLSAWRRAGAPLAGWGGAEGGAGIAESRSMQPGVNGPAHAQASKAVLCVDWIYRSKDMAFPRKRMLGSDYWRWPLHSMSAEHRLEIGPPALPW
jgi:hypothetical protein